MRIVRGGSYLGFDRFGLDMLQPDDVRVASLLAAAEGRRRGERYGRVARLRFGAGAASRSPTVTAVCGPARDLDADTLLRAHRAQAQSRRRDRRTIETLLVHNPRRFFEGTPPPRL
jgi:phosphotriesterase-related protein